MVAFPVCIDVAFGGMQLRDQNSVLRAAFRWSFFTALLSLIAGCGGDSRCSGNIADNGQVESGAALPADAAKGLEINVEELHHFDSSKLNGADPLLLLPAGLVPDMLAVTEEDGVWGVARFSLSDGRIVGRFLFDGPLGDFDWPVAKCLNDIDLDGTPEFALLRGATDWSSARAAKLRVGLYSGAGMRLIDKLDAFDDVGYGRFDLTLLSVDSGGRGGDGSVLIVGPHSVALSLATRVYECRLGTMKLARFDGRLEFWVDGRIVGLVSCTEAERAGRVLIYSAVDGDSRVLVAKSLPGFDTLWTIRDHESLFGEAAMCSASVGDADRRGVEDLVLFPTSRVARDGPAVFCVAGEDGTILWSMKGLASESLAARVVPDLSGDGLPDVVLQTVGRVAGVPRSTLEVCDGATGRICATWSPAEPGLDFGTASLVTSSDNDGVWCVAGGLRSGLWLLRFSRPTTR